MNGGMYVYDIAVIMGAVTVILFIVCCVSFLVVRVDGGYDVGSCAVLCVMC